MVETRAMMAIGCRADGFCGCPSLPRHPRRGRHAAKGNGMTVGQILDEKGAKVVTVAPDQTVLEVTRVLTEHHIGAALIMDGETIAGVLSERDIVRCIAAKGPEAFMKPASELMTRTVITCRRSDDIARVMAQMTKGRFRHVPVVENGQLIGLVSIGDVVKRRIAETEHEAEALREYIATG